MQRLNIILFTAALLVVVIILAAGAPAGQKAAQTFMDWAAPVLSTFLKAGEKFGTMGEGLKTLEQLEAENRELLLENRQLRTRLQVLEGLQQENEQLREALGFVRRAPFRLIAARVIGREASTWWNTVRINRGFEDGIEEDMPVITEDGLVGKITAVSKSAATVTLITDETCRVGAAIEGTRERGIAQGRRVSSHPGGEVEVNFLNKNAPLEKGMRVLTAGVEGGVFPPDLVIGTVESFRVRELDGQALVRPAVDLSSLRDVFIILQ